MRDSELAREGAKGGGCELASAKKSKTDADGAKAERAGSGRGQLKTEPAADDDNAEATS